MTKQFNLLSSTHKRMRMLEDFHRTYSKGVVAKLLDNKGLVDERFELVAHLQKTIVSLNIIMERLHK